MRPKSCDTFVALPPATADGCTIFGKNSDRDSTEVQEVIYVPAADHAKGAIVQVDNNNIWSTGLHNITRALLRLERTMNSLCH